MTPWIASSTDIFSRLALAGCPASPASTESLVPNHHDAPTTVEAILACCGIDEANATILDFGTHERHEMFGTAFDEAVLGVRARERSRLLYSNGEDYAYGALFRAAFEFSAAVKNFTSAVISEMYVSDTLHKSSMRGDGVSADVINSHGADEVHRSRRHHKNRHSRNHNSSLEPNEAEIVVGSVDKGGQYNDDRATSTPSNVNTTRRSSSSGNADIGVDTLSSTNTSTTSSTDTDTSNSSSSSAGTTETSDEYFTPAADLSHFLADIDLPDTLVLALHVRHMPNGKNIEDLKDFGEGRCIGKVLRRLRDASSAGSGPSTSIAEEFNSVRSKYKGGGGHNRGKGFNSGGKRNSNLQRKFRNRRKLDVLENDWSNLGNIFGNHSSASSSNASKQMTTRKIDELEEEKSGQRDNDFLINKRCILLIASDRNFTYELLNKFSVSIGCIPIYLNDNSDPHNRKRGRLRTPAEGIVNSKDHGNLGDSIYALADIHLLSYAHAFIGSAGNSAPILLLTCHFVPSRFP